MKDPERAIIYERGDFFALIEPAAILVMRSFSTHAISDSAFSNTADGQSLAIARVDYLAKTAEAMKANRH